MEPKVKYVLVGLFVVLLGAGSVVTALWLTRGISRVEYDAYDVFVRESVAGLTPGAPVKYLGVDVGQVAGIAINPDNSEEVRLTLEIARGTPIKEDTNAVLGIQGLTGLMYVELQGGSRDAPILAARTGQRHPVIESIPSTRFRIDTALTVLSKNLTGFMEDARSVLTEENREKLSRILDDLSKVTAALARRSDTLGEGVADGARAAKNVADAAKEIERRFPAVMDRLSGAAEAVQDMAGEVGRAGKDVAQTSRNMGTLVEKNRGNIERFTGRTLPEIEALVTELRHLAGSLERLSRNLEREPESLLYGRPAGIPGPGEAESAR